MEIRFKDVGPEIFKTDLLVVPVFEKKLEEVEAALAERTSMSGLEEKASRKRD